tara:strand:- start:98 stop:355 length:258 start_codon:yes stop_codon:yes gene_type:complete
MFKNLEWRFKIMSTADYTKNWYQGIGHSLGAARFAGQTRNRRLTDKSIMQTTYGFHVIHGTGLVATISEIIKSDIIDSQIKRLFD